MLGAALMVALAIAAMHGALTHAPGMILAVKWIGIVILTGLAVQMLRARPSPPGGTLSPGGGVIVGLLVVVRSPSVLIFLLANLPQVLPAAGVQGRGSVQTAAMMFLAGVLNTQIAAVALATAAPPPCPARRAAG